MPDSSQAGPGNADLANLLLTNFGISGGSIGQDAQGNYTYNSTDNNGTTHTSSLQDQMTPDQWSQFQNEMQKGYITNAGNNNYTIDPNKAPMINGQYLQPDAINAGASYASLGANKAAGPDTANITNKNEVAWNPNYGYYTQQNNMTKNEGFLEKAGTMLGNIAPAAIAAAMGAVTMNPEMLAGEGSMLGAGSMYDTFGQLGSNVFNQVGNAVLGNKPTAGNVLGDVLGVAGNIPGVSDITNAINSGVGDISKLLGNLGPYALPTIQAMITKNPALLAQPAIQQFIKSVQGNS